MFQDSHIYREHVHNGAACNKDTSKYMYMKYNYMWYRYFKLMSKNSSLENSLKINYRKIIES